MPEFYKIKQKEGPTILFERRDLPVLLVMVAAKIGAAYETINHKGIAHFSEHIVFRGTKTKSAKEISSSIEKVGGILNAFTADEVTAFWAKIPSKHFNTGTDVIFDLVANPALKAKDIEKERNIILSEISRNHDLPQDYLFDKIKELLYAKPFGLPILGFKETVSKFKKPVFENWHKYYNPENLIISVVGNTNLKDIDEASKNYFIKNFREKKKGSKGVNRIKKVKIPKPRIIPLGKNKSIIEKRHGLDQTHLAFGFHSPSLSDKRRYAAEVFNAILGEGMSSHLFQEVREKKGLAYAITSFLEQEKDYGYSVVYAGIEKKNIKKVKEIITKEIKNMAKINSKELEQAKEQKIGNWELSREACDKTATNLIFQEIATKAEDFYDYPKKINDVNLSDVKKLAKIKNYVTAILTSN